MVRGWSMEDTLPGVSELFRSYLDLPDDNKLAMRLRARECFEQRFEIKKAARNPACRIGRHHRSELASRGNRITEVSELTT